MGASVSHVALGNSIVELKNEKYSEFIWLPTQGKIFKKSNNSSFNSWKIMFD